MRPASAAPAAGFILALSLASAAGAQTMDRYGGGALPAAPYAAQPQQLYAVPPAYAAGSARAYPGVAPYRTAARSAYAQPQAVTTASAGLRTLSWPGKEQAGTRPPAPMVTATYRSAAPTYAILPTPTPRYAPMPTDGRLQPRPFSPPQPSYSPPPAAPSPTYAFAPPPAAAPTSIYSDAPATAPQAPQAYAYAPAGAAPPQAPGPAAYAATNGGSRQYSLHREYGLAPDPAPIPPQFFANTADLSAPETPDVITTPRVTGNATTAKATENAARLAASAAP